MQRSQIFILDKFLRVCRIANAAPDEIRGNIISSVDCSRLQSLVPLCDRHQTIDPSQIGLQGKRDYEFLKGYRSRRARCWVFPCATRNLSGRRWALPMQQSLPDTHACIYLLTRPMNRPSIEPFYIFNRRDTETPTTI